MEIGLFQAAHEGYAGRIHFLGQPDVAIAIIPTSNLKLFSVLLAGKSQADSLLIGSACYAEDKLILKVTLDSPLLETAIEAEMTLRTNQNGNFVLRWERQ